MKSIHNIMSVVVTGGLGFLSCGRSGSSESLNRQVTVLENSGSKQIDGTGARYDGNTELETGFQGLLVGDIYIVDAANAELARSDVASDGSFSIVYEDVRNFTVVNDKVYPGLSIVVTDEQQNIIFSVTDQFASKVNGISEKEASELRATIRAASPLKTGRYMCYAQITDKYNQHAAIASTWHFNVR